MSKPLSEDANLLQQIVDQRHKEDEPSLSEDKYFELFSAEQVLKGLDHNLDPDELRAGIVSGGDDGGVDSFYLFVNGRLIREDTDQAQFIGQQLAFDLVIIQSKTSPSFDESTLSKLREFTDQCLRMSRKTEDAKGFYNEQVLAAVQRFKDLYRASLANRPTLRISYVYASLGEKPHPKVVARAEQLKVLAQECFTRAEISVELAGAERLYKAYYDTTPNTATVQTVRQFNWSKTGKAYACLATLKDYAAFITRDGEINSEMFEANVRDHQGPNRVNQEVAATLASQGPEDFWWLNNGVTVLASEVRLDGDTMTLSTPLIVNGLQTSYGICKEYNRSGFAKDERTVLVRVIETSDPETIDRVIRATNNQTKISPILLHATEEIHRKIETVLRTEGLYYDRRKNHYRNQGVPSSKIVTMPALAQAIAAIALHQPDDARARPTTLVDQDYNRLFSTTYPIAIYSKSALIMRRVSGFLDGRGLSRAERLNLGFYVAMHASVCAIGFSRPTTRQIAQLDLSRLTDALLQESLDFVKEQFTAFGGDDQAAKGSMLAEVVRLSLAERFPIRPRPRPMEMSKPRPRVKRQKK